MNTGLLNEAFQSFAEASRSLESSYSLLQSKVEHLTEELRSANEALTQALSEARRHKDYLEAILHSLEEAIVVTDPRGRITTINRSAGELFGLEPSAVAGCAFASLGFSVVREGSDVVFARGDRRIQVIMSRSPVLDEWGNMAGEVILIKDITRLRELEAQQERNHRLISMGEMAAKIVHEVRNPLCSMELFAGILAKDLEDTPHQELARGISTGISNLNTILTNMLLFARPRKPSLKRLELGAVVEESVRMFLPLLESRGVSLEQSLAEGVIAGDEGLLRQVVANLIVNAVQAVNGNGRLKISMRRDGDFSVVDLCDNGVGIGPGDREKIFDPFFSTKESGTGLGLAIASRVMQAHGGYIKVTSEVGRGSTFSLYFPAPRQGQ